MTAHTPGPWITNGCVVSARVNLSQRDICTVSASAPARGETYNIAKHLPELQANARLIASAPELLAVVRELQESAAYWSEYDVPLGIVERINTAVAKATGSQP